jgi:ankyrin repeat protein
MDGNTPLQIAIMRGHAGMVELLLNHPRIDYNTRNAAGHTALWLALGLPDQTVAKVLVDRGCDINLVSADGDSMLHYAVGTRSETAALFLIQHGANASLPNKKLETPLHVAARLGMPQVVSQLLAKGTRPGALTAARETPLLLALYSKEYHVAQLILSAYTSTDLNARDAAGNSRA